MTAIGEFVLKQVEIDERTARASLVGHHGEPIDTTAWDFAPGGDRDMTEAQDAHHRAWSPWRVLAECAAKRAIVECHEAWPTLTATKPEITPPAEGARFDDMTFTMTQSIMWQTEQEYVKRFGIDPPTSAMMLELARVYADRPGFREEWAA